MIEIIGLNKTYPDGTEALVDIQLRVRSGEMVLVRGHSGAGKSTLFRLVLGIDAPTSGVVEVDGLDVQGRNRRELRSLRRDLGVVFQDFRLIPGRTAQENVEIGMRVLGVKGRALRERAQEWLEAVGLQERMQSRVETLSWGERQRVATARALARRPSIILADEPTGNLDEQLSTRVLGLLTQAHEAGATVMVATHDQNILQASHRVITLDRGRLVADTHRREGNHG